MLKSGAEEDAVSWINDHLAKHGGTTSGLYLLSVSRETARRGVSSLCCAQRNPRGTARLLTPSSSMCELLGLGSVALCTLWARARHEPQLRWLIGKR